MTATDEHPCASCGRFGPLVAGAGRERTHGTVAALLEAGWIVACPAGHRRSPDIGAAVVAEVHERLPVAERRRLGRVDRCTTCAGELSMPPRRTERAVPIADLPGVPVTTIRFDLPSTRCPSCSTDQVPTRSIEDVRQVVLALFAPDAGGA
ncbi:MAG: hypothetical protein WEB09_07105 [Nitriliruptor sp.]